MYLYTVRLRQGDDLRQVIQDSCVKEHIRAGVVLSAVGSLETFSLRIAGASTTIAQLGEFEILSVQGTVSENGLHLHASLSDADGRCYGGHLIDGCRIRTTCELVILHSRDMVFGREFDSETGFDELQVT